MTEIIHAVDLFCGGGGTSTGLALACKDLGRKIDLVAINHWKEAVETHTANHEWAKHICANVESVDPREAVPGGRLNVLVASPECFPAGTLILSERGLVPIEDIQAGDGVLTHLGRWKRVTATKSRQSSTVIMKGKGHPGLETTPNHPFYVRSRRLFGHEQKWVWSTQGWLAASEMKGKFWATPTVFPQTPWSTSIPPGLMPTQEFWWFVGRWLGDGYADTRVKKGGSVSIASSFEEANDLRPRLAKGFPGRWTQRNTRTATLLETRSWLLVDWLVQNFGKLASGKTIPVWALTMPQEWRQALLEGYLSADGHEQKSISTRLEGGTKKQGASTVSKRLAIGIRLLAESLGYRASLHKAKNCDVIEGRKVDAKDLYTVIWPLSYKRNVVGETELHSWGRIRSVSTGRSDVMVYNLSVEDDESYVADGIVVHNCTFHSRAAGGRPKNDQRRASAWSILRWLELLKVDSVLIENVPEFENWGPLDSKGYPIKSRKGEIYQSFISAIRAFGYTVDTRVLNAADFGAPTSRSRLFIQGRKGNNPVGWPTPTHSKRGVGKKKWRAAREIIDWSLHGESIYGRKRPLSPRTYLRIIEGLKRFGGPELKPFILLMEHGMNDDGTIRIGSHIKSVDEPLPTITTAKGGSMALVEPGEAFILSQGSNGAPKSVAEDPVPSILTAGKHAIVEPLILSQGSGGAPRSVDDPMATIPAKGAHALVASAIVPMFGERKGQKLRVQSIEDPLAAVTSHGAGGLAEGVIVEYHAGKGKDTKRRVSSVDEPLKTIDTGNRFGIARPFVLPVRGFFGKNTPKSVEEPLGTITQRGYGGIVEPFLIQFNGTDDSQIKGSAKSVEDPLHTTTANNHSGFVEAFLAQYNGNSKAQSVDEPLPTISTKDRFGLVLPIINGRFLDIRFRMLQPHELAGAMGFPKEYKFCANKTDTVRMIGNAVSVDIARALCTSLLTKPKGGLFSGNY